MTRLEIAGNLPMKLGLTKAHLEQVLNQVATYYPKIFSQGVIELKFVGSTTMRKLNSAYAGKPEATDVLSFAYDEGENIAMPTQDEHITGVVVICTPLAIQQAIHFHLKPHEEASLLFVHGLMHIAGLDHQTPSDQASFGREQSAIMKAMGLNAREFPWSH